MKKILLALVAALALCTAPVYAADEARPALKEPTSAVAVVICGEMVAVVLSFSDGEQQVFTDPSKELIDVLREIVSREKRGVLQIAPTAGCPSPLKKT